jgi:ABC-type glycerol-3-phosphate transport system substrate-binding protein
VLPNAKIWGRTGYRVTYFLPYVTSTVAAAVVWRCNRSIYVVYYNKPALTSAGFPDGPQTWDDFQAACDKIVQAGAMQCYAIQPNDGFVPIVWSRGGEVTSKDFKTATFNGPEAVAALTFDISNIKANKAYVSEGFDWQNDFGSGKVSHVAGDDDCG